MLQDFEESVAYNEMPSILIDLAGEAPDQKASRVESPLKGRPKL